MAHQIEVDEALAAHDRDRQYPDRPAAVDREHDRRIGRQVVDADAPPHGPVVDERDPLDPADHPLAAVDELVQQHLAAALAARNLTAVVVIARPRVNVVGLVALLDCAVRGLRRFTLRHRLSLSDIASPFLPATVITG